MSAMRNVVLLALVAVPLSFAAACSGTESSPGSSSSGGAGEPGAPVAPTGLEAAQMGTGIHLTWKDNSSDESEFELQRKEGTGEFAKVASVVFDTVQFHDTGVSAGKTYTYRARAVSAAGARSAFSNEMAMDAPKTATGPVDAGAEAGPSWDGGAVSFEDHIIPLFQRSCGSGTAGCHVRDAYGASSAKDCRGWLTLENASLGSKYYSGTNVGQPTGCPDRSLFDRLTQLDAWQEPGGQRLKYVKPGDPAKSYLFSKIGGGQLGDDGPGKPSESMPPKGPLAAIDIAMVKKWIESGAPQ